MAKKRQGKTKLQVRGGLNPSPPIGPAQVPRETSRSFANSSMQEPEDKLKALPVVISVYADKSFDFVARHHLQPFNSWKPQRLKGSGEPNRSKVHVNRPKRNIAEDKRKI